MILRYLCRLTLSVKNGILFATWERKVSKAHSQVRDNFRQLKGFYKPFFSTWQKSQDKNLNIVKAKRVFKKKWKAFFTIFKGLSLKQVKQYFRKLRVQLLMVVEKFTLTGPTFISVSKIILELFRKLFCFISRSFLKKLECVQNKRNSNQFVRAF